MIVLGQRVRKARERFDDLSARERVMAAACVLAVIYVVWHSYLMRPLYAAQQQIANSMSAGNADLEKLTTAIDEVFLKNGVQVHESVEREIVSLRYEIENLDEQQGEAFVEFISPREMIDVLKALIGKIPDLKLLKVQSSPAEVVVLEGRQQDVPLSGPQVYRHTVLFEFEGDYYSSLKYFQKLEALPWKFYWDFAGYQVVEYPKARIRLVLHTLSLSDAWLGV